MLDRYRAGLWATRPASGQRQVPRLATRQPARLLQGQSACRLSRRGRLDANGGVPGREIIDLAVRQGFGDHRHHLARAPTAPELAKLIGQIDLRLPCEVGGIRQYADAFRAVALGTGLGPSLRPHRSSREIGTAAATIRTALE